MLLPRRRRSPPPTLFDVNEFISTRNADGTLNHGRCRTAIGQYFEAKTASTFGGTLLRTDSRCDYCPDVEVPDGYLEVKAVGLSNQTFIYDGRLMKDLKFSRRNNLKYVIWRHNVATNSVDNLAELYHQLSLNTLACYVVPFRAIWGLLKDKQPQKLNSKYGRSLENPTYGAGYRIPLGLLKDWIA